MGNTLDTLKIDLERSAVSISDFDKRMAEAKSLRQTDNPEGRKDLYDYVKPENTLEGKAANALFLIQEAWKEAMKRYPDSHAGLTFFAGASGLLSEEPTEEQIAWAKKVMEDRSILLN